MLFKHRIHYYISLVFGMLTNVGMQLHLPEHSLVHGMLSTHWSELYISLLLGMPTNVGMQLSCRDAV